MDKKAFVLQLYEFLKESDTRGYFDKVSVAGAIAKVENYLSDYQMVKKTIKDIEEIPDIFDDRGDYIACVKPIIDGLYDIQAKLEAEQGKRMIANIGYEVKYDVQIGDREIVIAENMKI